MNPDFEAAIVRSLGGHALTPVEMAMLSNHLPVDNPEEEVYHVSDSAEFCRTQRLLKTVFRLVGLSPHPIYWNDFSAKQKNFIRNTDMLYCLKISNVSACEPFVLERK